MTNQKNLLDELLNLKEINEFEFQAPSHNPGWDRIYGGQVIAQAIMAASNTVTTNDRCHSMHGYFMRPGNPELPVTYSIEPVRNGRSFQTRMVHAIQGKQTIFSMGASFHKEESGPEHQDDIGDVPPPEELPPVGELIEKYKDRLPGEVATYFQRERPFEMRPVDLSRYMNPQPAEPVQSIWLKLSHKMQTAPGINEVAKHQAALGYASDFTLLDTSLIAHGKLLFDPSLMLASLDHSIWFHRPFDINDWLLYRQTSSNAYGARALCHGQIFSKDGKLVASTAQEGLTRPKK